MMLIYVSLCVASKLLCVCVVCKQCVSLMLYSGVGVLCAGGVCMRMCAYGVVSVHAHDEIR